MEIYGCTYTEYREQYEKRLSFYKDKYEDRSESIFLEREMINFKDIHNVLVSIHNSFIKNKDYTKLVNDSLLNTHLNYLKSNYNNVFRKLFEIGPPLLDASQEVSYESEIEDEKIRGYVLPPPEITIKKLDNLITSTKRILEFIYKKQHSEVPGEKKNDNAYKNHVWFKFGVQLASGNLRKYYDVNSKGVFVIKIEYSARKIADELDIKNSNNIISGTFNNYSKEIENSNRNIFNDPSKILKIKEHCDKNGISIVSEFSKRIPNE